MSGSRRVRRAPVSRPARQRGIAMLVAILLVALATILAAAIGFKSAMAARRGTAALSLEQSLLVAEAAEALAAYALREDKKNSGSQAIDHAREEWGQPLGPVEVVPGVTLEAYLEDATGRFNLNSLISSDNSVDQQQLRLLEYIMARVEIEPKWASLIADWIDPDSNPLPDGAEDSAYASQDPPYRAPNTFITSPSELLALPGFGRDRYLRLAPYVTALPANTYLNVCSAQGVVIDALIGEDHVEFARDAEQLGKSRENGCFPTPDELKQSCGSDTACVTRIDQRVKQSSTYFRLTSVVTIGSADFNLYSLLQRDERGQVRVLMRSFTPD